MSVGEEKTCSELRHMVEKNGLSCWFAWMGDWCGVELLGLENLLYVERERRSIYLSQSYLNLNVEFKNLVGDGSLTLLNSAD